MDAADRLSGVTGFTLIEVAVALLIFSIGILGVVKLQAEVIKSSSFSAQMSDAVNLAEDKVEELTAVDPSTLALTATTSSETLRGQLYKLSWAVSTTGVTNTNHSRLINLTVGWREHGIDHSMDFAAVNGQE